MEAVITIIYLIVGVVLYFIEVLLLVGFLSSSPWWMKLIGFIILFLYFGSYVWLVPPRASKINKIVSTVTVKAYWPGIDVVSCPGIDGNGDRNVSTNHDRTSAEKQAEESAWIALPVSSILPYQFTRAS